MRIRYLVRAAEPAEHLGRFTIELGDVPTPTVDLVLPSWVPGSYHIVPYQRTVGPLTAVARPDGTPRRVERIDKGRWRVHGEGATELTIDYDVYGHDLVTEGFDLTPDHLFLNAALCLPGVAGHADGPHDVALEVPPAWRIVTELPRTADAPPTFRARSYDELVDSPIDAGSMLVLTIQPHGIPHRISLCGDGGNYDAQRLTTDVGKIADAAIDLIGESPLTGYTFFYHLTDRPDGGLEHATSNSSVVPRNCFAPEKDYKVFLGLTSHEYFHLYNVKRILPQALLPWDLSAERYTRLLWWMEGTTDYFSDLILRRAGLFTPKEFLENAAKLAQHFYLTPGRTRISLEDASFLAWIDYYQPYEATPNRSVSYYLKGHLVSLALDLEIRHRSENRASLETALRMLWTEFGKVGRPVPEDALQPILERSSGLDLAAFFDRFVRGTDELELAAFAPYAGLVFAPKAKPKDDGAPTPGYLGARVEDAGGLARFQAVYAGSPARAGGLTAGDELAALNGNRVRYDQFEKTLGQYPPGTPVEVTVFRRGRLKQFAVTMGTPPPEAYEFTPAKDPSELARRVYAAWVGAAWEPAKPDPTSAASPSA